VKFADEFDETLTVDGLSLSANDVIFVLLEETIFV
jgi:hypothetical protein